MAFLHHWHDIYMIQISHTSSNQALKIYPAENDLMRNNHKLNDNII